jgi:Na+-transporting methylmalonyl-CoA/oxaloacetate decarboxylase beta subunit
MEQNHPAGNIFYGTGVMTILTGFAQTPLMLALGLAGIGIFASIYHPVGISWLVYRTSKTGTALGFNGLFGSIGFFWRLWLQEH